MVQIHSPRPLNPQHVYATFAFEMLTTFNGPNVPIEKPRPMRSYQKLQRPDKQGNRPCSMPSCLGSNLERRLSFHKN
jgi:hypothetical protein